MAFSLKDLIDAQGGLANTSKLASHWGVSTAAVVELTARQGFPEPVAEINGSRLWLVGEADEWRETKMPRRAQRGLSATAGALPQISRTRS